MLYISDIILNYNVNIKDILVVILLFINEMMVIAKKMIDSLKSNCISQKWGRKCISLFIQLKDVESYDGGRLYVV